MTLRTLTARFAGTCDECGGAVAKGDKIAWARGETYHDGCRPGSNRGPDPSENAERGGYDEDAWERAAERSDNAEYRQGMADARRYSQDRKTYGVELAEQWEMEEEMKHAWD